MRYLFEPYSVARPDGAAPSFQNGQSMPLAVDVADGGGAEDENASPLGKRKSELISPSSRRPSLRTALASRPTASPMRGPLFVNANPATTPAAVDRHATPSKPRYLAKHQPRPSPALPPRSSTDKYNGAARRTRS